jgi:hypothetical protein
VGYIELSKGIPAFNKAIISFWFRVPKLSLDAMKATYDSGARTTLSGVLPLITFGPLYEGYKVVSKIAGSGSYTYTLWYTPSGSWAVLSTEQRQYSLGGRYVKDGDNFTLSPSYVGVRYNGTKFVLSINLQSASYGSPVHIHHHVGGTSSAQNAGSPTGQALGIDLETHYDSTLLKCVAKSIAPGNPHLATQGSLDASALVEGQYGPDAFEVGDVEVSPDTWHHVLASFDVSKATSAQGTFTSRVVTTCAADDTSGSQPKGTLSNPCQLWLAFDDVNQTGERLRPGLDSVLGPNDIISRVARAAFNSATSFYSSTAHGVTGCVETLQIGGSGAGSYTYEAGNLPSFGYPFGIPGASNVTQYIYDVDMAEFQMWLGKTLDTSNMNNRRVFVDYLKDANGNPVTDEDGNNLMKPVSPTVAEAMFDRPQILLHGTKNWKDGENHGTLGMDKTEEGDTLIPEGQFTPFGTIKKFKPDPSLRVAAA